MRNFTRIATIYVNGEKKGVTTALKDATDFIPYIGVLSAADATAKTIYIRGEWISRKFA